MPISWVQVSHLLKILKIYSNRVPTKENPKMSRHHQFQSTMTITGASCRLQIPNQSIGRKQALINLLAAVGGSISGVKNLTGKDANDGIAKSSKRTNSIKR